MCITKLYTHPLLKDLLITACLHAWSEEVNMQEGILFQLENELLVICNLLIIPNKTTDSSS